MSYLIQALAQADTIEQMLIQSGGELTPEIEQALTLSEEKMIELVDAQHLRMERMEKVAEFYKSKAEQYSKLASSIEKVSKFTKQQIKDYLLLNNKTELVGNEFAFKLSRTAPAVEISDESKVPEIYIKIKTEEVLDKKKLAEDLKKGIEIEGAILKEVYSLRSMIKKG